MKIYDYEKNTVESKKFEKSQFYCFHPCHVGVLCSKTDMQKRRIYKILQYVAEMTPYFDSQIVHALLILILFMLSIK